MINNKYSVWAKKPKLAPAVFPSRALPNFQINFEGLEEKSVIRLGRTRPIAVDLRIVSVKQIQQRQHTFFTYFLTKRPDQT